MPIKNLRQLAYKLKKANLKTQVAFNVLTKDKLICPGLTYLREKDAIKSRYYAVVSSRERPEIYFKQKLGEHIWGIQIPYSPKNSSQRPDLEESVKMFKEDIKKAGLEIIQEYVPDFLSS